MAKRLSTHEPHPRTVVNIDRFAPYLLNQVTSRINAEMREALRPFNMSVPRWRVLLGLWVHDGQSIGDLSVFTVMAQPTVSRVVDQMARDGLVERRPLPANRRIIQVFLTETGERTFEQIWPIASARGEKILRGLNESTARMFVETLNGILKIWD